VGSTEVVELVLVVDVVLDEDVVLSVAELLDEELVDELLSVAVEEEEEEVLSVAELLLEEVLVELEAKLEVLEEITPSLHAVAGITIKSCGVHPTAVALDVNNATMVSPVEQKRAAPPENAALDQARRSEMLNEVEMSPIT